MVFAYIQFSYRWPRRLFRPELSVVCAAAGREVPSSPIELGRWIINIIEFLFYVRYCIVPTTLITWFLLLPFYSYRHSTLQFCCTWRCRPSHIPFMSIYMHPYLMVFVFHVFSLQVRSVPSGCSPPGRRSCLELPSRCNFLLCDGLRMCYCY